MVDDDPQTKKVCRAKHKILNTLVAFAALGAAVAFVLPLWSHAASRRAEDKANEVDKNFGEHEAAQEIHEQHLRATLSRIESKQEKIYDIVNRK